jgi:hypothetical protein
VATGCLGRTAGLAEGCEDESSGEANAPLGLRIAGAERLKKGVGFSPYAFDERLVFHAVLASGLKFRP